MTKLTQEEQQQLSRDLDVALSKMPPKFSSRDFRIDAKVMTSLDFDWFCAVVATVLIRDPGISLDALFTKIDARVARAGALELAAAVADAEFEEKH